MAFWKSFFEKYAVSFNRAAVLLFIILTLVAAAEPARAQLQELEINPISVDEALPVFLSHPDMAVIIIRSSITSLTFDSSFYIVEQRSDPAAGEYILIIETEPQSIRVNAPGFMSQSIPLRGLSARQVLYYSVEPAAQGEDGTLPVVFRVQPPDASLFINGEPASIIGTLQLSPGSHEVRIECEGYASIEETIVVSTDQILFEYRLDEIDIVPVRITSNVPGARVSIDGMDRGEIDSRGGLGLFLFPDSYELEVTASGHIPVNRTIEVQETGSNSFGAELQRNIGTLVLEVEPGDASIQLNGENQALPSTGILELSPASYVLEISRAGYFTYRETFTLEVGQRIVREVSLESNTGVIMLELTPGDARVEINRQHYANPSSIELTPGRYRLEVSKDGYAPYSESVDLALNQTLTREIVLQAYTGSLQFSVVPSDARVQLRNSNGEVAESWEGLNLLRNLRVGNYTLEVSTQGFVTHTRSIEIQRDETSQIQVELIPGEDWPTDTVTQVVDVTNPVTGRTWMDRNLGASRAATSSTDSQAYGDLYQWGRAADGHQQRNSPTTITRSRDDQPGHGSFIIISENPMDWRIPRNDNLWRGVNGINRPCPSGYRLATEAEWNAERQSWSSNNAAGAFASPLKLPLPGLRSENNGSVTNVGSDGYYWSSTVDAARGRSLFFNVDIDNMRTFYRARGFSVRCIKN